MEPFRTHVGLVAAMDRINVDTDQIIPKQFLKRIERTGFGRFLFHDWRFDGAGNPRPDFELNRPRFQGASVLLTGPNFGCGSSREHAPWALEDYGFRAIIAPSFADIFYNNCFKNGMLPVQLEQPDVRQLMEAAESRPGYRLEVDLVQQTVSDGAGLHFSFQVDPFRRRCLLEGLDDIGLTLQHEDEIRAYERRH